MIGESRISNFTIADIATVSLTEPVNDATVPIGTVILKWNTLDNTTNYKIILDENAEPSTLLDSSLTANQFTFSNPVPGKKYYWKIQAFNGDILIGESRISSFTIADITTISLTEPANDATVPIGTVILKWNTLDNTTNYKIILDENAEPSTLLDSSSTANQFTFSNPVPGKKYYWKIQAFNGDILIGESRISNFTIADIATVSLTEPANDATVPIGTVILKWNTLDNTTNYKIILDENAEPSALLDSSSTANQFTFSNPVPGKKYYWKIQAFNGDILIGESRISNFTIADIAVITITAPIPELGESFITKDLNEEITFSWSSKKSANKYQLIFSRTQEDDIILDDITTTTITKSDLPAGTYSWEINAFDSNDKKIAETIGHELRIKEVNVVTFTYDGKKYEIIKENKNWVDAAATAVARGGFLAEIDSENEQNAIFKELQSASITASDTIAPDGGAASYIWIGGNDMATEGTWIWDGDNDNMGKQFWEGWGGDGRPIGSLYNNWGHNNWGSEPDDFGNQDGLGLAITEWPLGEAGQWNDVDHTNTLYFLVEYK